MLSSHGLRGVLRKPLDDLSRAAVACPMRPRQLSILLNQEKIWLNLGGEVRSAIESPQNFNDVNNMRSRSDDLVASREMRTCLVATLLECAEELGWPTELGTSH